jgi:hypothetical protein
MWKLNDGDPDSTLGGASTNTSALGVRTFLMIGEIWRGLNFRKVVGGR